MYNKVFLYWKGNSQITTRKWEWGLTSRYGVQEEQGPRRGGQPGGSMAFWFSKSHTQPCPVSQGPMAEEGSPSVLGIGPRAVSLLIMCSTTKWQSSPYLFCKQRWYSSCFPVSFSFSILIFKHPYYISVNVCSYVHVCGFPWKPEESVGSPEERAASIYNYQPC